MSKTLEQLEGFDWGELNFPSSLVTTCHRLRRKPIDEFTTEDLRIMIGQNFGLEHLLPRAMDVLRDDPIAAGDFYEGDLIQAVLRCDVVKQGEDKALCGELAGLCLAAIKRGALHDLQLEEDEAALAGSRPPRKIKAQAVQDKIEMLKFETPWLECHEHYQKHGSR